MLKEIIVEDMADFQQQIGVDKTAAKQVMHILPCAADLLRQPPHTTPLMSKLFFNEVSDMRFVACGHVVVIWVQKKAWNQFLA